MTKLQNRVARLESRLEERDRIEMIAERITSLHHKINAIVEHFNLDFKEGTTVVNRSKEC